MLDGRDDVQRRITPETSRLSPSHLNFPPQYSENIVDTIFTTISNFVWSVAVTSIKTFLVFSVIFECSELIIGGIERTVSF